MFRPGNLARTTSTAASSAWSEVRVPFTTLITTTGGMTITGPSRAGTG